ncbi:3-oxoacyl-(acyl-carrier-protein) synthase, KASII [Vibrio owensii]|uniref:beta-ketoacyl-[acyl-carrier-protein] synthase family protein n=1 Tax=Vibrio owensii TaxID=696485 RepID=UPI0028960B20|nr:3-oxoacyl-(acyl-carrier-protein) synthase, KASII [Vibrio owensii]CAH1586359.1 3-oxoacyl-(acyl-carrier-protein) synthase, KASII [Vibrio owensii]
MKKPILSSRRCVITGYGSICSLGDDTASIWQSIMNKSLGYQYQDFSDYNIHSKFFGNIKKIPSVSDLKMQRCLSREGLLTLSVAHEAINHAFNGQPLSTFYLPESTGVIMGSGWAGVDASIQLGLAHHERNLAGPFSNLKTMPSSPATACAIKYNLRGFQNTVMAACASSSIAIGQAFREIQRGTVDMMLAGGVEAMQQPAAIWSIDVLQALSKEQLDPEKASCPFSSERSGFVLSEGAAIVVLEELESAKRRGAMILGEVLGYGYQGEAESFIGLSSNTSARSRSMQLALTDAGVDAQQLDYINAHGTSTLANDIHETRSIKAALGKEAYRIPILSRPEIS